MPCSSPQIAADQAGCADWSEQIAARRPCFVRPDVPPTSDWPRSNLGLHSRESDISCDPTAKNHDIGQIQQVHHATRSLQLIFAQRLVF